MFNDMSMPSTTGFDGKDFFSPCAHGHDSALCLLERKYDVDISTNVSFVFLIVFFSFSKFITGLTI